MLLFVLLIGCGEERIADVAAPQEITDKSILFLLPSYPEELCYADNLTEILNSYSQEINGTNPQVASFEMQVDCAYFGFTDCVSEKLGDIDGKEIEMMSCSRASDTKICNSIIDNEYKDAEGGIFDETCVLGIDKK